MAELSPYDGAPVVDEIFVDGRRILITCRRNYDEARLDRSRSVAKSQGKRLIQLDPTLLQAVLESGDVNGLNDLIARALARQ